MPPRPFTLDLGLSVQPHLYFVAIAVRSQCRHTTPAAHDISDPGIAKRGKAGARDILAQRPAVIAFNLSILQRAAAPEFHLGPNTIRRITVD